jgi:nitrous oxidase accessory protein NosD
MAKGFSVLAVLILLAALILPFTVQPSGRASGVITVPDDYSTIQEAINHANNGDTVFVKNGTYLECVQVNKSINLLGENVAGTFITKTTREILTTVEITANNVTLRGFTISNNGYQPPDFYTILTIVNVTGSHCKIFENVVENASVFGAGVTLLHSSQNIVSMNKIYDIRYGVILSYSNLSIISYNNITGAAWGLLNHGENFTALIADNFVSQCYISGLELGARNNFTVVNNTICHNHAYPWSAGIELRGAQNMRLYHNNFFDNGIQVGGPVENFTWDDGYPSGGNYYGDYTGVDVKKGANQFSVGSDGIGDTKYTGNLGDNYPLMKPYPCGSHDIGIASVCHAFLRTPYYMSEVRPLKNVVGQGSTMNFNVFVFNYGTQTETFNVTVHVNATTIDSVADVAIPSKECIIMNMTWDTTSFAKGKYTLWSHVTPVSGETSLEDNNSTSIITVSILGDYTGPEGPPDSKVDIRDISRIARLFGVTYQYYYYNPNCDIMGETSAPDGIIDIRDVSAAARNFGRES